MPPLLDHSLPARAMITIQQRMKTIRGLSFLAAFSAFYLLVAGAQVNAHQAALSVPDWPLSYGRLLAPDWPGNVFYEQHHRAVAASTLVLFVAVVIALARREDLSPARRMSRYAAGALGLQTLLGGLIVLRLNPPWLGAIHVVVAVGTVVLIAATALLIWAPAVPPVSSARLERIRRRIKIALGLLILQLILGSVTRHPPIGELTFVTTLLAHLFIAVILTMFLVLLGASMARMTKVGRLRMWGCLLLTAVLAQIVVGTWVFVISPEPLHETWPPPPVFPAAHAAHLVLAAIIATCLVAPLLARTPAAGQPTPSEP